jgi:hypothetical protein
VLTPTYPGFEGGVDALREDPSSIEALTFPAIIEHLTQILLDHGYGAAGVAIDSVPAEGVRVTPCALIVREHAAHPCCREEVLP